MNFREDITENNDNLLSATEPQSLLSSQKWKEDVLNYWNTLPNLPNASHIYRTAAIYTILLNCTKIVQFRKTIPENNDHLLIATEPQSLLSSQKWKEDVLNYWNTLPNLPNASHI